MRIIHQKTDQSKQNRRRITDAKYQLLQNTNMFEFKNWPEVNYRISVPPLRCLSVMVWVWKILVDSLENRSNKKFQKTSNTSLLKHYWTSIKILVPPNDVWPLWKVDVKFYQKEITNQDKIATAVKNYSKNFTIGYRNRFRVFKS